MAAATTTQTGIVGFIGAEPSAEQEELRAGFEAGATSIDPDIEVVAAYLDQLGFPDAPFDAPDAAIGVAGLLYGGGADVIFHAAGRSGVGILQAADSELAPNKRWVIGVNTDEWQTASARHRPHILTSIIKHFDEQIYTAVEDHLDGSLDAGARRLTVADEMITYSLSGDALSPDARVELDRATQRLASGEIQPPRRPKGSLTDPASLLGPGTGSFVGADPKVTVKVALPAGWEGPGDSGLVLKSDSDPLVVDYDDVGVGFWSVANVYADPCRAQLADPPIGPTVDDLASALADLPGDATTASDTVVDGFPGKQIEFTIPDYTQDPGCFLFYLWQEARSPRHPDGVNGDGWWGVQPHQHNRVWILEVDGTRLVIMAWYLPDTSDADRADLDEIIGSIEIG